MHCDDDGDDVGGCGGACQVVWTAEVAMMKRSMIMMAAMSFLLLFARAATDKLGGHATPAAERGATEDPSSASASVRPPLRSPMLQCFPPPSPPSFLPSVLRPGRPFRLLSSSAVSLSLSRVEQTSFFLAFL